MALRLEQLTFTSTLNKAQHCAAILPNVRENGDSLLAVLSRRGVGSIRQAPRGWTTLAEGQSVNEALSVWVGVRAADGEPDQYEVAGSSRPAEWDVALFRFTDAGVIPAPILTSGVGRPNATGVVVPQNALVFNVLCCREALPRVRREVPAGSALGGVSRYSDRPSGIFIAQVYDTPAGQLVTETEWGARIDNEYVCFCLVIPPGVGLPAPATINGRQVIHAIRMSDA